MSSPRNGGVGDKVDGDHLVWGRGFIDWLDALIPIRIIMCHVASVINGSHNDAARISENACANVGVRSFTRSARV
jgi:hypothetical protein